MSCYQCIGSGDNKKCVSISVPSGKRCEELPGAIKSLQACKSICIGSGPKCWSISGESPCKCIQQEKPFASTCFNALAYSTESACLEGCRKKGKRCYRCTGSPPNSDCGVVFPGQFQDNTNCSFYNYTFDTPQECNQVCKPSPTSSKCWYTSDEDTCECSYAEKPTGSTCSDIGFSSTQQECQEKCRSSGKSDKKIIIIVAIVGGIALLLLIIGIVGYLIWRSHKTSRLALKRNPMVL